MYKLKALYQLSNSRSSSLNNNNLDLARVV